MRRRSFSRSRMVMVPRRSATMPSWAKYFSTLVTTSRRCRCSGHLVMGDPEDGALLGGLVPQKNGGPPVHPHEKNLLHGPHDIGETLTGGLVEKEFDLRPLLSQGREGCDGKGDHMGLLNGLDEYVEDDGVHQAGGGENTGLTFPHPVQCHLPPFLGQKKGPKLAGQKQQDALAVLVRPVGDGPLGQGGGNAGLPQGHLFLWG